jgi:hypothetical protein
MREAGVVAARPKRRHVYPAGETSRVAANVLNRAFDAARPDHKMGRRTHPPVDGGGLGLPRRRAGSEVGWAVNKYIHFYNTRRIHSAVSGMSPNQAEQRFLKQS